MAKAGPFAIIIGVSEYASPDLSALPACVKDGEAIETILLHTGRFEPDNIFKRIGSVNSTTLKSELTQFFALRSGWNVEEILFYYSGHGEYTSNEFYYLLSDYDGARLRQTSLEGTEIDNLVRNINPDLYIKIVDACHSGLRYIKSRDDFDSYVKRLTASFKSLYFMFSSLSEQFSYGGKDLSRFTRYLVNSVRDADKDRLRYKDLIDAVSDAMIAAGQTPYFITQAKFTEVFCEVDKILKEKLSSFIVEYSSPIDTSNKRETDELFDLIKSDAARYASHAEAKAALDLFAENVFEFQISNEISRYYELDSGCYNHNSSFFRGIGRWLEQENAGEQYFAEPTYDIKTRTKRVPLSGLAASMAFMRGKDYEEVEETYKQLSNFDNTVEVPYKYILIKANEKLPNIDPASCFIVPIISKTTVRFFWGWFFYDYIDWEKKKPRDSIEWQTACLPIKDDTKPISLRIMDGLSSFLHNGIVAKWKSAAKRDGAQLEKKDG